MKPTSQDFYLAALGYDRNDKAHGWLVHGLLDALSDCQIALEGAMRDYRVLFERAAADNVRRRAGLADVLAEIEAQAMAAQVASQASEVSIDEVAKRNYSNGLLDAGAKVNAHMRTMV